MSNHVHPMDCTMVGIANFPSVTYYPTLESNFGIPIVRHLIKLLHAIPIPKSVRAKIKFNHTINELLQNGKTLHFYPEGSLWPYYTKIRHFKDGAFRFAVENNVPVIPMVYTFEESTGILKYLKKKHSINLHILKPIYPNKNINKLESIKKLKEETYNNMNNVKSS